VSGLSSYFSGSAETRPCCSRCGCSRAGEREGGRRDRGQKNKKEVERQRGRMSGGKANLFSALLLLVLPPSSSFSLLRLSLPLSLRFSLSARSHGRTRVAAKRSRRAVDESRGPLVANERCRRRRQQTNDEEKGRKIHLCFFRPLSEQRSALSLAFSCCTGTDHNPFSKHARRTEEKEQGTARGSEIFHRFFFSVAAKERRKHQPLFGGLFLRSLCPTLAAFLCSQAKNVPKPPSCGWRSRSDMHRGKREKELRELESEWETRKKTCNRKQTSLSFSSALPAGAKKNREALTRLVLSRVTPCLSCSLGLDYSPLELIPRARARERKKERNAEQREPLKQAINQIDRQSWCVAFPLSLGVFQACFTVALACKERADKPYRRRTSQFSLSLALSLPLSPRERGEKKRREREGHRRKSMGAMLKFSSLSSFPFLALPLTPTPISSHYPSPFLRLQPLRLDIKVRMDLKKERRGVGLCFLFSLLFSFFNASLFFSRSPIKLLPIFLFLPLPTHQQKRFSQRTDRVKGVDLHPTEPW
jgi:hypothetical protein